VYDVIICGLGPAGSILAAALDNSLSVLAIDKKSDTGRFKKPCGGLLAPDAQKALAQLGLNLPKEVLVDPQIFSVRTIDMDNDLIRNYQRMYINLDRHKFDLWLMSEIPKNISIREGVVTRLEKTASGYKVLWLENGEEHSAECKYVVGADGAHSRIRRSIAPDFKCRSYLSIQQWFHEENPVPFYSCIFDRSVTGCYSWTISKDGYFIFGGAYPHKNARQLFEKQKTALEKAGMKFGEAVKTEACLVLRPASANSFCCGKDGAFLIGEAAGFISPSSLEGISSAIKSATALAEVLNGRSSSPLKAYRRKTAGLRRTMTLKIAKCPFMYNPTIRKLVMLSGLMTIPVKGSERNVT